MDSLPVSDIVEWDALNWAKALGFWNRYLPQSLAGMRALEVGARHGGLSLYLATRGCNVTCTDLYGPTDIGRERHRAYGVADRLTYGSLDVTHIPFADASFDIVVFKSLLGEVGWNGNPRRQQEAIDEMHRVLKPGGWLLVAENIRGSRLHMFLRRKFVPWGNQWRYVSIDEMRGFISRFSSYRYVTYGFWGTFGRSERQRRLLHLLDVVTNPLLPETSRYILFGCAVK